MSTVTVKELKEFLESQNDSDKVYMSGGFNVFDIVELREHGSDGYPYKGYVLLKGEAR